MFSLSGKIENQIPCFPCAVATLLKYLYFAAWVRVIFIYIYIYIFLDVKFLNFLHNSIKKDYRDGLFCENYAKQIEIAN